MNEAERTRKYIQRFAGVMALLGGASLGEYLYLRNNPEYAESNIDKIKQKLVGLEKDWAKEKITEWHNDQYKDHLKIFDNRYENLPLLGQFNDIKERLHNDKMTLLDWVGKKCSGPLKICGGVDDDELMNVE